VASASYDDYLIESLRNQRRAKAYLNAALEDGDPRVFLLALRNVAKSRGLSDTPVKHG
jgi:DNA-binding phage protein